MSERVPYEIVDAPRCRLGEGARFDAVDRELSWVDIPGDRAFALVDAGTVRAVSPGRGPAFTIRLVDGSRIHVLARGLLGEDGTLLTPPGLSEAEALNDGSVHPTGRALIVGSKHVEETIPVGQAWLLTDRWTLLEWRFTVFNGGSFSPDGRTLYFTDSPARTIWRAPFDCDRLAIGERAVFAEVPESLGYPDGMVCDDDGFLWSAHWDGGCVTRYRPDGTVHRRIELPTSRLTSVAFFGPDRNRLAVTSALADGCGPDELDAADPAGRVFTLQAGASGPPSARLAIDLATLVAEGRIDARPRS